MVTRILLTMVMMILMTGTSFAAHPLITDDTGTQGKGKFQVEVDGEFDYEKEAFEGVKVKEEGSEIATIVSAGVMDNMDIVATLPYQWIKVREDGEVTLDVNGISDASLEIKWRFYEKDAFSFALKPGIIFPTGNERKDLGNGKLSFALTFITTVGIDPWAIHLNLGYGRNNYELQEDREVNRKDIWYASLAGELEVIKDLKVVANVGIERNSDKESNTHPAFILGGVIYSISENFDIDFGIRRGLNKPETDYALLAGIALRF
jgi:hypothetical protein